MGRLIVLTTPRARAGLPAGRRRDATRSALRARRQSALDELLARPATDDVIAVHEPFFNELARRAPPPHRLARLSARRRAAGRRGRTTSKPSGARRLLRMLWQAVGYEITFDRGEADDDRQAIEPGPRPTVGEIHGVAGPVVVARGLAATRLYNVVEVGQARPRRAR